MKINGKTIGYGIAIVLVLLLVLISSGIIKINLGEKTSGDSNAGDYSNIPEKCRPAAGQNINSWKEHLSHHAETQDCLKYFN